MHYFTKRLLLVVTLLSWATTINAIIPLVDRATGIVQSRPYCPARPASPEFQRAALYEFISEIFFEENGVTSSFENFIDENYIQHNSQLLSGRNNTLSALLGTGDGIFLTANITILQVLFDAPYGMVHYKFAAPNSPVLLFMDLWRFNGTCIEEHWDVIQTLDTNSTNPVVDKR